MWCEKNTIGSLHLMNQFDGIAGSNRVEERNVDAHNNMHRETKIAINWESEATPNKESGRTACSDVASFMKKNNPPKTNRKG